MASLVLRQRDLVALIVAVILSRMVWNTDSSTSLSATTHLSFFMARQEATFVSSMDLDGDGTSEAMAVVQTKGDNNNQWVLRILDLKRLHPRRQSAMAVAAPFEPPVLFSSEDLLQDDGEEGTNGENENAIPLKLTTGQVLIHPRHRQPHHKKASLSAELNEDVELNDRNRQFFCGNDWHDASMRCHAPCAGGLSSECPEGETCFADTGCDIDAHAATLQEESELQKLFDVTTPGGGLPSVVTLWSNGALVMHSLTKEDGGELESKKTKRPLHLRRMWQVTLLSSEKASAPRHVNANNMEWEEVSVLFLDAYDSQQALGAEHGVVIVSGSYYIEDPQKKDSSDEEYEDYEASFIVAVDAMKGTILWDSFSSDREQLDKPVLLPLLADRGWSSHARRRSQVMNSLYHEQDSESTTVDEEETSQSCLVTLRQSIQEILPHSFWSFEDASLTALHMDMIHRQRHKTGSHHNINDHHDGGSKHRHHHQQGNHPKRWQNKLHGLHKSSSADALHFGRPNVVVAHGQKGLQVRSLRNGRVLCHMSFMEETTYVDLNNDGVVDQVQLLLDSNDAYVEEKSKEFVSSLASKIQDNRDKLKETGRHNSAGGAGLGLCHAMGLSGLPAKEHLFSAPLCGKVHEHMMGNHPASLGVTSVAPVIVESLTGRRNTRDVIVALNNGMVHRIKGTNGRNLWSLVGQHLDDFPTWEESENAILTRVSTRSVPPALRPVLLVGENSMTVVSVTNGKVLASMPFPQTAITRPVLTQLSGGDHASDLIVFSEDGIWGFQIIVQPGSPVILRLLVGLLFMGLMLAMVKNQFKTKRATDA